MVMKSTFFGAAYYAEYMPYDRIDTDFQLMKDAGCFLVAFGFESGSDEILKRIKKGTTVADNVQAAKWCHEVGLPFWGFFVIGFPWETKKHIMLTKKLMAQLTYNW